MSKEFPAYVVLMPISVAVSAVVATVVLFLSALHQYCGNQKIPSPFSSIFTRL